jgi:hypothetical protein
MLKPEVAKKRLEQWQLPSEGDDDAGDRPLLDRASRLPRSLRTIAFALLGRDAEGKEIPWQEQDRYQETTCAELDAWAPAQRLRLFGEFFPRLAGQVEQGWQFLKGTPYTHGPARRAFRAPRHAPATLPKRRAWLIRLLRLAGQYQGEVVTASWLATWAPHLGETWRNPQDEIGQLLAAVIDAGGPEGDEVFDILVESLRNEHEIGGMGRHVTRALLLSARPDG